MNKAVEKLKEMIQQAVEKELDTMQFTHAMSCEKSCGGKNNEDCEIKDWWLEYKELVKEEGASYLQAVKFESG